MSNALLFFHQGWTDIINCLPLITWYSRKYKKLYVLMREDAWMLVQFYIRGTTNVVPIYVSKQLLGEVSWRRLVDIEHHKITKFELIAHYDSDRPDNDPYKGAYARRNALDDAPFERLFYEAYEIPYIERVNSFVLYRDPIAEEVAYEKLVKREPYICTHTNPDLQLYVKPEAGVDIVELNQSSPMFFDYIRILQHAKAIHVIDSVWAAICYMIDAKYGMLETVPVYLYCHRGFHRMFTQPVHRPNWTIVYPKRTRYIRLPHGVHMALQLYQMIQTSADTTTEYVFRLDADLLRKYREDMTDNDIRAYEQFLQDCLFKGTSHRVSSLFVPDSNTYESYEYVRVEPTTRVTHLAKLVSPSATVPTRPYIVLNTKLVPTRREESEHPLPTELFHAVQDRLYHLLNAYDIDVVLLGERRPSDCAEYKLHDIYTMYSDHLANLHRVIDKTYEDSKDGLATLGDTCAYLNHSAANLFIGNGGGLHLYCAFPNTVQLGEFDRLLCDVPPERMDTHPVSTSDVELFLTTVERYVSARASRLD